jgi:sulfide:quinone oxidoreductase
MRVLIVGGGVGALETTLALESLAGDRVDVQVLAPDARFSYRPLWVAEPFVPEEPWSAPLARLVKSAGALLRHGTLAAVDLDERIARADDGAEIGWDVLVLALGARMADGVPGSLTFRGPAGHDAFSRLVDEAVAGRFRSLTFALPGGVAWALPLYELAFMTDIRLEDSGQVPVRIDLMTPEEEPLGLFGHAISRSVERMLASRGIRLHVGTTPVAFENGTLEAIPETTLETDRVVSLPTPRGRSISGLAGDRHGFIRTDAFGRLAGRGDVYAVGDMTAFPIKHGGIATEQADVAAEAIAAVAGAPVVPRPFRPVLRGLLFSGLSPRFLAADLLDGESRSAAEPLWSPPHKIVGRYLAPFLAEHGLSMPGEWVEAA